MASHPLAVFVTTSSPEEAAKLAHALVERKLAACANIIPGIRSIYRWKGEVCEEAETLLLIKTTAEAFPRLQDAVKELHSYETPECIGLEIIGGLPAYLLWLTKQVEGV